MDFSNDFSKSFRNHFRKTQSLLWSNFSYSEEVLCVSSISTRTVPAITMRFSLTQSAERKAQTKVPTQKTKSRQQSLRKNGLNQVLHKPEAMQEPNLMPFFVSFAKAGDASWLADDVVTLDDESFGVCWLDDDFA